MFLIRSVSTTDYMPAWNGHPAQKPVPYHIYLMRPETRRTAWWNRDKGYAQQFKTEAEARAYIEATTQLRDRLSRPQVVPFNDNDLPPYWAERPEMH
jgi:hypothetical protein